MFDQSFFVLVYIVLFLGFILIIYALFKLIRMEQRLSQINLRMETLVNVVNKDKKELVQEKKEIKKIDKKIKNK